MKQLQTLKNLLPSLPLDWQLAVKNRLYWLSIARPKQIPLEDPNRIYRIWLAGRGFGKTRTAVEDVWWWSWCNPKSRYGVVCATMADIRKTAFDGESGLLSRIPPELIADYNKSLLEIKLTNGSLIQGFTAEKPDRLRGPQFHRVWCDEIAIWRHGEEVWDMIMFCLRLGDDVRINITTTPKPISLLKELIKDNDSITISGSTYENKENLSKIQIRKLEEKFRGTRLGRQEIYAEMLEDIEGALWTFKLLEKAREFREIHDYTRVIIAIDPAVTSNKNSDETGIIVAAVDTFGTFVILEDISGRYTPSEWANRSLNAYHKYDADCILGEVNNGGDLIEQNVKNLDQNVKFIQVRATRGKVKRAEPISALYEQNKVFHLKRFPELEEQMTSYTGDDGDSSPDRLDALVWALTELSQNNNSAVMPIMMV